MIIAESKIHTFLHDFLVNISRHFLPFGRADLTSSALVKLSSRAERGDLLMSPYIMGLHSLFRAKRRNLLRSSQRRLLRCGPFAVRNHSGVRLYHE